MEEIVFKSKHYTAYQSDRARCFTVEIQDRRIALSFCQLLAFRQKVMTIDIDAHFDPERNPHGFEILTLCNREHLFILDTLEIVDLKIFVEGIFALSGAGNAVPV
ncbi:hypothetical protein DN748_18090 [Sinomicrobium soli]|nr:hypothetical protein DN748_18090 [Sinomicrobium sp. N-1-3-6]